MAVNAHDVQIFVWKMIKQSPTTCFNVLKNNPYIALFAFFMILVYMFCPLFSWISIFAIPIAVATWIILRIRRSREVRRENEKKKEIEDAKTKSVPRVAKLDRRNKAFSRVQSVRRRKAKELTMDDDVAKAKSHKFSIGNVSEEEEEEEEKILISSSSGPNAVSLTTLVEECPKEIHEVDTSCNHEFYHDPDLMRSLKLLREDEDTRDEANKAMDVGISDAERTKRLESLIARRKSRKVLNLQVRRSLMSNDVPPAPQIPPMVIPKINTWCSPGKAGAFSPAPGSAPSVMIPLRNPFDLPYDPQEEKLDLTGDSFHQEFGLGHNRDMMFCRHESFTLGPSLPMDFFDDDKSSVDEFGFRRRRSSISYQFSKPEPEESDIDFGQTTDADSGHEHEHEHESESNIDSHDDDDHDEDDGHDHIKEVIQVHENVAENNRAEGSSKKPSAPEELSLSSNSNSDTNSNSSSAASSEDERPVRIINREAILKSLSMRRNSVDIDTSDSLQDNDLTYANSALENASRLKQEYFAHKPPKHHGMTFSIASDMQVEVSEMSSPPLTVDENMSGRDDISTADGEMDRNTSWDGLDSWAGSSRMSEVSDNETRLARANEAGSSRSRRPGNPPMSERSSIHPSSSTGEFSDNGESQTTNLSDQNPVLESNEVIENNANVESNQRGGQGTNANATGTGGGERVHHTTISPKSVLQPTLSVASFEPEGDDEVQLSRAHSAPQNATSSVQINSSGDAQASQESSRTPSNTSNGKEKILEDFESSEEVGESSNSQAVGNQEPPPHTVDEKMKIQENIKDSEGANPTNNEMGNPIPPEGTEHEYRHEHESNHPYDKKDDAMDLNMKKDSP